MAVSVYTVTLRLQSSSLRLADACEFFIGQGFKVGLGGHLMGQKVTDQVAEMRSFLLALIKGHLHATRIGLAR
ncbi:MAG: hypothetical protein Ct9H300mP28_36940 [Pseudomonadota bacterium]|nr:MAG: hypothetical protein Ct9H300mP28_36940 [Pseudomonadota bacterium]